jgi:predicted nucleic acid-binding protein
MGRKRRSSRSTPARPPQELGCGDPDTPTPVAVVDTNIIVETYSDKDMISAISQRRLVMGSAARDERFVLYRKKRVRDSVIMSMHLAYTAATTCSYHEEPVAMMRRIVPPRDVGGLTERLVFTELAVWFVFDRILSGWTRGTFAKGVFVKGNAADALIVAHAKRHGLPLITNEGYRPDGCIVDEGMREVAVSEGVSVYTPGQFNALQGVDESLMAALFLNAFEEKLDTYAAERRREYGPEDAGGKSLEGILMYYRYILDD